jgi:hypothetical protein
MNIVKTLEDIERSIRKDSLTAEKKAELIVRMKGRYDNLSDIELCECAIFARNIFLDSAYLDDLESAQCAIQAYERIIALGYREAAIYESYILVLELTYQYEKSFALLKQLYNEPQFHECALKFLSGFCYCAEGLMTMDEHMKYKKESIKYGLLKVERKQSDA